MPPLSSALVHRFLLRSHAVAFFLLLIPGLLYFDRAATASLEDYGAQHSLMALLLDGRLCLLPESIALLLGCYGAQHSHAQPPLPDLNLPNLRDSPFLFPLVTPFVTCCISSTDGPEALLAYMFHRAVLLLAACRATVIIAYQL